MRKVALLAVVCIAVLGAAGAWFVFGGNSPGALSSADEAGDDSRPVTRRQRSTPTQGQPHGSSSADAGRVHGGQVGVTSGDPKADNITGVATPEGPGGKPETVGARQPSDVNIGATPQGGNVRGVVAGGKEPPKAADVTNLAASSPIAGLVTPQAPADEPRDGTTDTGTALSSTMWTPERFEQRFRNRGQPAPEATFQAVVGKVMSSEDRTGIAFARVVLHSFLYPAGMSSGPVVPIASEGDTDPHGNFKVMVPLPKKPLTSHPSAALTVLVTGNTQIKNGEAINLPVGTPLVVAHNLGQLITSEANVVGIVWTPQRRFFDVNCITSALSVTPVRVAFTGQLDAALWEPVTREEILRSFPSITVSGASGVLSVPMEVTLSTHPSTFFAASGPQGFITSAVVKAGEMPRDGKTVPQDVAWAVTFDPGDGSVLSGQVRDPDGYGIDNASVTLSGEQTLKVVTTSGGWYTASPVPRELRQVVVEHAAWVTAVVPANTLERPIANITLATPRPNFKLYVTDALTNAPVKAVRLAIMELVSAPGWSSEPLPDDRLVEATSDDGMYLVTGEWPLQSLSVSAVGYSPRNVELPQGNPAEPIAITLNPSRKLELRPDEFSRQDVPEGRIWSVDGEPIRWFKAKERNEPDSDDVYTYWSHIGIEYTVDFNQGAASGTFPSANFDLVIGCRNQWGLTNNKYAFDIEVQIDGVKIGNLSVLADIANERNGTINLGMLEGTHTIRLVWLNDEYIKEELDANLRITSLKLIER